MYGGLDWTELEELADVRSEQPHHSLQCTTGKKLTPPGRVPINGTKLLIVVDSFSTWIESTPMKSTTAGRTIPGLSVLFSNYVQITTCSSQQKK